MKKQKSTYEKRKEILESPYREGVVSVDGESLGIRPMTQEECEFLDKFNSEFGCANISYDNPGLHKDLLEQNKSKIERVKQEIESLREELESIRYPKSGPPLKEDRQTDRKKDLVRRIHELESELLTLDPIKDIRKDNYNRSNDPLNYHQSHINIMDVLPASVVNKIRGTISHSESDMITILEENKILSTSD